MEFEEAGPSEQNTQQMQSKEEHRRGKYHSEELHEGEQCEEEQHDEKCQENGKKDCVAEDRSQAGNSGVRTDDYKELIVQMRKSSILFQQMSSVPLGELTMLLAISRQSERVGAVRVSGLGTAMKLSRPAVSRMLHILQKKGYIQMKNGEEDQRYVFVTLTDKGRGLLQKELAYGYRVLEKVRERMGDRCLNDYLRYCGKFHEILSEEIIKLKSEEIVD